MLPTSVVTVRSEMEQARADLLVAETLGDQPRHLRLSLRQRSGLDMLIRVDTDVVTVRPSASRSAASRVSCVPAVYSASNLAAPVPATAAVPCASQALGSTRTRQRSRRAAAPRASAAPSRRAPRCGWPDVAAWTPS